MLGGAIGVGLGFGLQKLAANYVSGFVVLAEQSVRIGDLVKVDGFEGRITDIHTRYTVIRALNGRESIVPNEMLITQRVENASLADTDLLVSTVVQVAYGTDLDRVRPALAEAVAAVDRVIAAPGGGRAAVGLRGRRSGADHQLLDHGSGAGAGRRAFRGQPGGAADPDRVEGGDSVRPARGASDAQG